MPVEESTPGVPPEAEMILSALEAGAHETSELRQAARRTYRVRAELRLFVDAQDAQPRVLYTRDADPRGLGFITPHRLPLGYGGSVELPGPSGSLVKISCTLLRCREAAPGWFEGALYFNRQQPDFAA